MSWKQETAGEGEIVLEWEYLGVECIVVDRTKVDNYCAYAHIYRDDLYENHELDIPNPVTYARSNMEVVGIDSGHAGMWDYDPEDIRHDLEALLDEVVCSECSNAEYKHGYCEECIEESPETVLASEI